MAPWVRARFAKRVVRARLAGHALRGWIAGRAYRAPVAAVVVLAGAGAALGMSASSPAPPHPAEERAFELARAAQEGAERQAARPGGRLDSSRAAYYQRTARRRVRPAAAVEFLPLHRLAGRQFGVDWRLLASIHRQETAFSTAATTYRGLNAFGCCAGPMQFNVTNGPVSTWKLYRQAFRVGRRPKRYPHRTRHHPSIYDDFDAIMAAASLLRDSGAGPSLDQRAWRAAYGYYGHDLYGVTYANEVLARAVAWERGGFCANCALDQRLAAEFDDAYGRSERRELLAGDRLRQPQQERRKRARERRARERRARRLRERADRIRATRDTRRAPARERPSRPPRTGDEATGNPPPSTSATPSDPTSTTATTPSDNPAATPMPAPAPEPCSAVEKVLGTCSR